MNRDVITGFISLLVLITLYYIIMGSNLFAPIETPSYEIHVRWDNVYGLKVGGSVRMKGVYVGEVGGVEFSNKYQQALVTLKIFNGIEIPKDSNITVSTGIFVGEKWVSIEPGKGEAIPRGGIVAGISPFTNEDNFRMMTQNIAWVKENVDFVRKKTESINDVVGDEEFRAEVKTKILNIRKSTEEFNELIAKTDKNMEIFSESFQQGLMAMASSLAATTANIRYGIAFLLRGVSAQVDILDKEAVATGEDLAMTVQSLKAASEEILASVEVITETFDPETGMPPRIKATLLSLRESCLSIEEGAQEIMAFSEKGAEYQEELKAIMANTNKALDRIDGTLTSVLGYVREEKKPLFKHKTDFEILLTGSKEDLNADVSAYLFPTEEKDLYLMLGVTDLNKDYSAVNLQLGKEFTDSLTLRAGMIKSSFGGGLDYGFAEKMSVSVDFFDFSTHNSFIDVRGRYMMTDNFDLIFGLDDVLNEREVKAGIGVQF